MVQNTLDPQERWWMLEAITGKSRAQLMARGYQLTDAEQQKLDEWAYQRTVLHKPLQYILGSVPFLGLEILVEPPILIPRPETEEIVQDVITEFAAVRAEPLRILDLCTGSGCIALALAQAFSKATVVGVDINPDAIALANKNAEHNKVRNVQFVVSDMVAALPVDASFDLIISNPPYIPLHEFEQLDLDVKNWESDIALLAHGDGLLFYRRIAQEAWPMLSKSSTLTVRGLPSVVCETGLNPTGVAQVFLNAGCVKTRIKRDFQGLGRCVSVWI